MKFKGLLFMSLAGMMSLAGCVDLDYNEATVTGEDWVYENPTETNGF